MPPCVGHVSAKWVEVAAEVPDHLGGGATFLKEAKFTVAHLGASLLDTYSCELVNRESKQKTKGV